MFVNRLSKFSSLDYHFKLFKAVHSKPAAAVLHGAPTFKQLFACFAGQHPAKTFFKKCREQPCIFHDLCFLQSQALRARRCRMPLLTKKAPLPAFCRRRSRLAFCRLFALGFFFGLVSCNDLFGQVGRNFFVSGKFHGEASSCLGHGAQHDGHQFL